MRHAVDGRKFGRNTSHRKAMFKNLANSVILDERVVTTVPKAKEVRRVVDRLVTLAKDGTPHAQRLAFGKTRNKEVVKKLFSTLADRYKARNGGYTRVLKISERRWGDAAEMALLELVDHDIAPRRKKKDVETPEPAQGKLETPASDDAGTGADPFGGFRKMFSGSRKKQKATKATKASAKSVEAKDDSAPKKKTKKASKKSAKKTASKKEK